MKRNLSAKKVMKKINEAIKVDEDISIHGHGDGTVSIYVNTQSQGDFSRIIRDVINQTKGRLVDSRKESDNIHDYGHSYTYKFDSVGSARDFIDKLREKGRSAGIKNLHWI